MKTAICTDQGIKVVRIGVVKEGEGSRHPAARAIVARVGTMRLAEKILPQIWFRGRGTFVSQTSRRYVVEVVDSTGTLLNIDVRLEYRP